MATAPNMSIRAMTAGDVDFATGLTHAAGWASESRDAFAAFLAHDPAGCFIAEAGGERAGICIASRFERSGFIGELVVSRHMRLLAIGQLLFQEALAYLLAAGLESIYLDGDLNAVSYYEKMGFRKVCRSLRFRGKFKGRKHDAVRPLRREDLDRLCAVDRELFGDDRSFFLRRRLESFPRLCLGAERGGELRGWIMARPGDGLLAVGPWAALEPAAAAPLLEHLASEHGTEPLRLGVLERNAEAVRLLRSWPGMVEGIHSWRMVRGPAAPRGGEPQGRLGDHPALYAIGSGAKG
jgi:ribosomal protein S18 acetylase RimI-like enzyme